MDDVYASFIEKIGQPILRQEVPASAIEHYRGKLPEKLMEYWAKYGWCGYGDGIFWTVDPQEYEGVVAYWINGTPLAAHDNYHVIARGAFGDLYLYGERTGFSLSIASHISHYCGNNRRTSNIDRHVQSFFLQTKKDSNDFEGLFEAARKKLGILNHNEMYGFNPALAFGGKASLERIEKVNTLEHLIMLSQLTALEPYRFSDF
ncbi:GAD-like domain-containing protein [Pseudomonas putida]|uniref:GAD-like domain-containing protein n=1 Tax=Pseudomonas putida TaxID=303 RepID=UPI000DFB51CA|nr:GAD-like domain-containing protein [Pseudomonas putida]SUD77666.1 GAD-like domain-containing protein [Pseudomonas putida]